MSSASLMPLSGEMWIEPEVVQVLTPEKEKHVPRSKIFAAPMQYVRANKNKTGGLEAKFKMVVSGHKDPELGQFRTDSPTTNAPALQVDATIAVSNGIVKSLTYLQPF